MRRFSARPSKQPQRLGIHRVNPEIVKLDHVFAHDLAQDSPRQVTHSDDGNRRTHRSSASMLYASAETIFSPATTVSALRAVALVLIDDALAFGFFVMLLSHLVSFVHENGNPLV
jgi:hypothetical protein